MRKKYISPVQKAAEIELNQCILVGSELNEELGDRIQLVKGQTFETEGNDLERGRNLWDNEW